MNLYHHCTSGYTLAYNIPLLNSVHGNLLFADQSITIDSMAVLANLPMTQGLLTMNARKNNFEKAFFRSDSVYTPRPLSLDHQLYCRNNLEGSSSQ